MKTSVVEAVPERTWARGPRGSKWFDIVAQALALETGSLKLECCTVEEARIAVIDALKYRRRHPSEPQFVVAQRGAKVYISKSEVP